MANYLVNEATGGFGDMPTMNVKVEAVNYEERGSFTVFLDENGKDVLSMKTEQVHSIRAVD